MPEERKKMITLIDETNKNGASKSKACNFLGLSTRTYQRWKLNDGLIDKRKGCNKGVANKITEAEKEEIITICCNTKFRDLNPSEIVPILAEEGKYVASESTFYRVLKKAELLKHRDNSRPKRKNIKPIELEATGPNHIWSWDITYLKTDIKGKFYYLYLFMDIWSRLIVGWGIFEEENGENASMVMKEICKRLKIKGIRLHSDNGSPMKSANMLATLYFLGVIPSFSRPRTSNDNAYSEALFRTVKYTANYPGYFKTINESCEWMKGFEKWYNNEHRHSRISYVTPYQRHIGDDLKILEKRKRTYEIARQRNPERWTRKCRNWEHIKVSRLNCKTTKFTYSTNKIVI